MYRFSVSIPWSKETKKIILFEKLYFKKIDRWEYYLKELTCQQK